MSKTLEQQQQCQMTIINPVPKERYEQAIEARDPWTATF